MSILLHNTSVAILILHPYPYTKQCLYPSVLYSWPYPSCTTLQLYPYAMKWVLNVPDVRGSPIRVHTFEVLVCSCSVLQCLNCSSASFQCVRGWFTQIVKQRILVYYHSKKNSLQIIPCLAEEGHTVSKAGILKFLSHYQEIGTIADAPGTGQASNLIDQIREIIKDQMKKNDETTGMEL